MLEIFCFYLRSAAIQFEGFFQKGKRRKDIVHCQQNQENQRLTFLPRTSQITNKTLTFAFPEIFMACFCIYFAAIYIAGLNMIIFIQKKPKIIFKLISR